MSSYTQITENCANLIPMDQKNSAERGGDAHLRRLLLHSAYHMLSLDNAQHITNRNRPKLLYGMRETD